MKIPQSNLTTRIFDINQSESSIPSQEIFVVLTNQNELFPKFEMILRSEQNCFI